MHKIVYLYSEVVGYLIPVFNELVNKYDVAIFVIHWDKKKLKPYKIPNIKGVEFINKSEFSKTELLALVKVINPSLIYVSGWMDKDYLYVTKYFVKNSVPVVTGFDDIWFGTVKQRVGAMLFPFLLKKYFTHAWVAGPFQYEYAKRLGFSNANIIFDLLTANTNKFNIRPFLKKSKKKYPSSFLYVGNFRSRKGTDILVKAYQEYKRKHKGSWKLICVGNGDMEELLKEKEGIDVVSFSSEDKLLKIADEAGVFILPSRHDQWGVVVHEFSSLGMPLLLSSNVGARSTFLIEGYNGYTFENGSISDLANKMQYFSLMDEFKLYEMAINSYVLSNRINISTSAANLMSILKKI